MNASSASLTRLGRTKSLVLAALVAAVGMLALAGTSKAAPVDYNLTADHGKLTLGAVFPDNTIIPAPVMGPHCPTMQLVNPPAFVAPADAADCGPSALSQILPNYPDGNAHVKVTVDGSNASVAAADFKMPMTYVPKPGDPSTMVPIKASTPNGLTGTWDAATGALDLTGDLRIGVATGVLNPPSPANVSWCQIDASNVTWSTGLNAVTPGIPFASGLGGNGAISAAWTDLPNGTSINSGDCSTVNAVIHDTGAIWLGVGEATPPPPPVCEPPLEGLWPDCVLPPANITKVAVTSGKVKAGKKIKLKVSVTNMGGTDATQTVTLKSSNKQVKVAKSVKVTAKAGKTSSATITVSTTKKAKGKVSITASTAGKSGKGTVTVQAAKKKKKK